MFQGYCHVTGKDCLRFLLDGHPRTWKAATVNKFSKRGFKNPELRTWQDCCAMQFRTHMNKLGYGPSRNRVVAWCRVAIFDADRPWQAGDLTNFVKAIEDSAKKSVFVDDRQVVEQHNYLYVHGESGHGLIWPEWVKYGCSHAIYTVKLIDGEFGPPSKGRKRASRSVQKNDH